MPSYHWAKLWIDVLDDHKLGPLDDHLWRRFFEFVLLAKEEDDNGWLPTARAIAWRLRTTEAEITADLDALAKVCDGTLVACEGDRWRVVNFTKRQESPMDAAERKRRQRERDARLGDDDATESVTEDDAQASRDSHETVTTRDTDKIREEKKRGGEAEESRSPRAPVPERENRDNGGTVRVPTDSTSPSYALPALEDIPKSPDLERAWPLFMNEMQSQMPRDAYDTWMRRLSPVGELDGNMVLGCADRYVFEWCGGRLKVPIARTLRAVLHRACDVRYVNLEATT